MNEPAWIPCDALGCANGLAVDVRHVRNFDGRDWYCPEHTPHTNPRTITRKEATK